MVTFNITLKINDSINCILELKCAPKQYFSRTMEELDYDGSNRISDYCSCTFLNSRQYQIAGNVAEHILKTVASGDRTSYNMIIFPIIELQCYYERIFLHPELSFHISFDLLFSFLICIITYVPRVTDSFSSFFSI